MMYSNVDLDIELRIGDEEHIGGVVAADGIERIVGFAHLAVCKLLRAETVSRLRDAGGGALKSAAAHFKEVNAEQNKKMQAAFCDKGIAFYASGSLHTRQAL